MGSGSGGWSCALLALLLRPAAVAEVRVTHLRTEHLADPLGLDKPAPCFGWWLMCVAGGAHGDNAPAARGLRQTSYRILVSGEGAPAGSVWDSGAVASAASFQVRYGGPPLESGAVYRWTVAVSATVDGEAAEANATGPTASFSMGMLAPTAWSGRFIGLPSANPPTDCPWFRKAFALPPTATAASSSALLSVASVGFHVFEVNGRRASAGVLLPSASFLPKRVLYRTYNVSALLKPGARNVLGIW